MTPRSYVLIHGGGSSARFWDRLIPFLDGPSLAINLPGRADNPADLGTITVDDEVASIVRDIEGTSLPDPLVIVAHSSGGLPVPGVVAALDGRVAHVVLNAASVPSEGGCGLDCMKARHREGLELAVRAMGDQAATMTTPGPPSDPEAFRTTYGGDPLDDDTLAFVLDPERTVTDTINHYFQPVHWSRAGDVPVTYILNEHDRPIPPELQEEMIGRLPHPARVVRLDSGHIPPITMPREFAAIVTGVSISAPG